MPTIPDPPVPDELAFRSAVLAPFLGRLGIDPRAPRWELHTLEPIAAGAAAVPVEIQGTHGPTLQQPLPLPFPEPNDHWARLHFVLTGSTIPGAAPDPRWCTLGLDIPGDRLHCVRLWRMRAWRDGSPLYAEWSELPGAPPRPIVSGWERGWRPTDATAVSRAMRLLLGLGTNGTGRAIGVR
jgi:hypothetical protein